MRTERTARGRWRRAIQRFVENPLAKRLLAGEFAAGDTVRIDVRDGALVFDKTARVSEAATADEAAEASV